MNSREIKEIIANIFKENPKLCEVYDGELDDLAKKELSNPKKWNRDSKAKLSHEKLFCYGKNVSNELIYKEFQYSDYYKFFLPPESLTDDCILRIFVPKHEDLQDTFRFEIFTTPDDKEIICYEIVID